MNVGSKQPAEIVRLRFQNMMSLLNEELPKDDVSIQTNREVVDYILQTANWSRSDFVGLIKSTPKGD